MTRRLLIVQWLVLTASPFAMAASPGDAAFPLPATDSFLTASTTPSPGSFALAATGAAAPIYYSATDAKVVEIAATALASDVNAVTGVQPILSNGSPSAGAVAVFVGTLGKNPAIDAMVAQGKIDVSAVRGKWEAYTAAVVPNPVAGVSLGLVIVGSDRRGTAYGIFSLSEAMGVSPWVWWGDVKPIAREAIHIAAGSHVEASPVVKYRGIFINDEDWGMKPWASKTFDPAQNDIGPKTYEKVFELLLRLRANYCWPAMHEVTQAFNVYPQNKVVADNYAIVMGSSHHEPMLRNTSEFDEKKMGPWSYFTNRDTVYNFWDQRVASNGIYENLYTIGMRGISDNGLSGGSKGEQVTKLQEIFADQRQILAKRVNPNPALVPQVFVPYKEVLGLYQMGLKVPDDVTLMWVDDNHGYIRQLSTPEEQKRSGGAGVYYHLSYWGDPQDYLWLCTTPPAVVWEEMMKAFDYNAKRVWIVNVGDIKPGEIGTEFFLELARNPEKFRKFSQREYLRTWVGRTFGPVFANETAEVLDEYYRLNQIVRPEHLNPKESSFSLISNGDENRQRLVDFSAMVGQADAIYARMPESLQDAFYELVLYPVRGSALMNKKMLLAERSRLWAAQGRASTNTVATAAREAYDKIQSETEIYNLKIAAGKWNRMMSSHPRDREVFKMPATGTLAPRAGGGFGVAVEGDANAIGTAGSLPAFSRYGPRYYFVDVFATGNTAAPWTATTSAPWITLSQSSGTTANDCRINVGVDWSKVPRDNKGTIVISSGAASKSVTVKLFTPPEIDAKAIAGAKFEVNGIIRVEAEDFNRSADHGSARWRRIEALGLTGDAMTVLPATSAGVDPAAIAAKAPVLEYDLFTFSQVAATISMHCLPTQRIHPGRGLRYAVALNDGKPVIVDIQQNEYTAPWSANIMRNAAIGVSRHQVVSKGRQTLRLWMLDPGVVADFFTVEFAGANHVYEFENLTVAASSGDRHRVFQEAPASAGAATAFEADADGDFVTYAVPNLEAGVYDLTIRVKKQANRGKVRLAIADAAAGPYVDQGAENDLYGAEGWEDLSPIRTTFASGGTKYFRFQVTGRNPANTSKLSWLAFDRMVIKPVE